jgi:hypothetical protein
MRLSGCNNEDSEEEQEEQVEAKQLETIYQSNDVRRAITLPSRCCA